jgi:hypothetical protein
MVRYRTVAAASITSVLLNSCSLYPISPTVRLDAPTVSPVEVIKYDDSYSEKGTPVTQVSDCEKNLTIATRECEVARALGYAQQANDKYLYAQAQYEGLPGVFGLVAIPVAAASLALGIQGEGGAPVTGLGVGTATVIGLGSFLQNKDRESVYTTGAEGIQCLISNMEPYTRVPSIDLSVLDWNLHSTFESGSYQGEYQDLNDAKDELEARINAAEALNLQRDCRKSWQLRRYASLLLKAAKASDKAASKAVQVGDDFIRTAKGAPMTIVNVTNQINAAVNANLIKTEPDIQKLSSNLKGAIPDQATDLAGINSLKSASADAQSAQATASSAGAALNIKSPSPEPPTASISGTAGAMTSDAATPEKPAVVATGEGVHKFSLNWKQNELTIPPAKSTTTVSLPPGVGPSPSTPRSSRAHGIVEGITDNEYYSLLNLQTSIYRVNLKVSEVTRVTGTATGTVDNGKCPILAKKAGEVKALTLNPDGDIVVAPGAKTIITLQGTTDPYVRPLFPQNVCNAVTATLKGNTMDVAATDDTVSGFYPFFVGDGPTGRAIDVMVSKSSKDTSDDVNVACPDTRQDKKADDAKAAKVVCPSAFPGPVVQLTAPTPGSQVHWKRQ